MNDSVEKKQIIANRLREVRKVAGLSQAQVAKLLGMHRPTVSEIEAGNRSVSAEELGRFAEIYDVNLSWLSGKGAEKLDPREDRLQLAFRELNKLKPDDIDRLMRVLAAMRAGGEQEGNDSIQSRWPNGAKVMSSRGEGTPSDFAENGAAEWTEEMNARRFELIDRKIQEGLRDDEVRELELLHHELRRHVSTIAPLPFEGAKRLHAALLVKQRSRP